MSEKIGGVFSVGPKPGQRKVVRKIKHGAGRAFTLEYVSRNEIAIKGDCVLVAHADTFFGGKDSKPFQSGVLHDPTWGDVFAQFEKSLAVTKDLHHIFLEGVHRIGKTEYGIPMYRFSAGS